MKIYFANEACEKLVSITHRDKKPMQVQMK